MHEQLSSPVTNGDIEATYQELMATTAALCQALGLSQASLGRAAGTTQSAISEMLGHRAAPRVRTLLRVLGAMGHTLVVAPLPDPEQSEAAQMDDFFRSIVNAVTEEPAPYTPVTIQVAPIRAIPLQEVTT